MKILYILNKAILIITAILYLTLFLGLYSQIVLGLMQVFTSIILLFYWKKIKQQLRIKLYKYWIIISIYGLLWLIDWNASIELYVFVFGVIAIPLCIAVYFLSILNKIYKTQ
ncbi:hypothetical protein [Pontimicrobium sp. SW4]|uniref:Uncharacterized protein n=1 Tax=Pontimicrobium sp. SW4 TaxID=3153519 RepID=A0AAU7BR72_9FLAO